jgi:cytochrome c-type biogenesis protein CcmE
MQATEARRKGVRWRYAIVSILCIGAVAWMLVLMQRNVVFFYPVSQAVTKSSHHTTNRLRIGGAVVPQSIKERGDGVDFQLVDHNVTVTVHHTGGEPPLFKDCAPVVAEGHWSAPDSMTFDSTRLLIKHGNDYRAPNDPRGQCPDEPIGLR